MATDKDILNINEAVESFSSEIWDCASLHYNSNYAVAISVEFVIGPDGKIIPPVRIVSTFDVPELVACIKTAVESWKFDPPDEPPVNVKKVYNFEP